MKDIEKLLTEANLQLNNIKAPDEMEERLRNALKNRTMTKRKRPNQVWKITSIVVTLLFAVMIGYNYNAFAYYGKKLLGFEELNTETLNELNQKGLGQVIDKKVALSDGSELTIEGLITDANYLFLYYTISNPQGLSEGHTDLFSFAEITGFLTKSFGSAGTAMLNDERTELKGKLTFDPVSPFAKRLTLHYRNVAQEDQQLTFTYEPNKALQTQLKTKIGEKVAVDKGTIHFKSLTATPASTLVTGTLSVDNFDRVNLGLHGVHLIANGTSMEALGSQTRSTLTGQRFTIDFDALPENLESLVLVVEDFVGYKKLNKEMALTSGANQSFDLDGTGLNITNISVIDGRVEMTVVTDEGILLDGVLIKGAKGETELETITGQTIEDEKGRGVKERTLIFQTKEKPESLFIEGIHYIKRYNQEIEINVK